VRFRAFSTNCQPRGQRDKLYERHNGGDHTGLLGSWVKKNENLNCFYCRAPVLSVRPTHRESSSILEGIFWSVFDPWTAVNLSRLGTAVDRSPCQILQSVVVRGADWSAIRGPVQSQARTGPDGPWGTLGAGAGNTPALTQRGV
jgi:hypothetical protein